MSCNLANGDGCLTASLTTWDALFSFTVPVVWDNKKETIVNNESSEILRMFNTEFNDELPEKFAKVDLYPDNLKKEIDEQNEWVYDTVSGAAGLRLARHVLNCRLLLTGQ